MSGRDPEEEREAKERLQLNQDLWTDSKTLWTRMEPRTRDADLEYALRAEVHDAAWMLCRQWQVGEFQGEDAGSPVTTSLSYARDRMSRFQLGGADDTADLPPIDTGDGLEVSDSEPLDISLTGDSTIPIDEEIANLERAEAELARHLADQREGGGSPQDAATAFEDYLEPDRGRTAADRAAALAYLRASPGGRQDFFAQANGYLGSQPGSELTAGGESIPALVIQLEEYTAGTGGWRSAANVYTVLVNAGTATTTGHLLSVLQFALDAARAYKNQQSSETEDGENGDDDGGDGNGGQPGAGTPQDYYGQPLEVLVEREPVATGLEAGEKPPAKPRAEAGQQFLRYLASASYADGDSSYVAADFTDPDAADGGRFVLSEPDEPLDPEGQRFAMLADGRALDGHEVYIALVNGVGRLREESDPLAPSWPSAGSGLADLPIPQGGSLTNAYKRAAKHYVDWYADLYDEPPGPTEDAWYPNRMEYRFSVATGPEDGETVLQSTEYPGGTLDWYSFSAVDDDRSLSPPDDDELTERGGKEFTPAKVRYPGMPVQRWWEFEDAEVSLDHIPSGPEELSKLLLLDFNLVYSNDWYLVPMETPIGTLTRITDFSVTDTFGETTLIEPVTSNTDRWNMFMFDDLPESVTAAPDSLDEAGEPGLFLPPTIGDSLESDPVERVYFSRDEMANMAFGVEERVESPVGHSIEREEFREPTLEIRRLHAGADVDDERVVLHNPGDAPLAVEGWELEVTVGAGSNEPTNLYTFGTEGAGEFEIPPEGTVTVHTGTAPPGDAADASDLYAGRSDPVWGQSQGSVTVLRPESEFRDVPEDRQQKARFVTREIVASPDPELPDYRLATSVPDHWYPLKPVLPRTGDDDDTTDANSYRLALSLLLDADSMDDPLSRIPAPKGRVLDTPEPLRLYEEEVRRAGREIERRYQLARWTGGSTHLWSSREVSTGRGEAASRLRYDVLSDPDGD